MRYVQESSIPYRDNTADTPKAHSDNALVLNVFPINCLTCSRLQKYFLKIDK